MRTVHTVAELRNALRGSTCASFVPTMGNLHPGHLSLVALAAAHGRPVVASVFVNRLQFAPHEDFALYPRTLARDCELLEAAGCDFVFAPDERELYPQPQQFKLHASPALADILEGHFRPGFFTGVCTVVMKLFNIVQPQSAIFGKKDYQQLLVVRGMVQQCAMPIDVVGAETIRESTGLAMSSRNGYLSSAQRAEAAHLHVQLLKLATAVRSGDRDYAALESAAVDDLLARGWAPDYVAVRCRGDLSEPGAGADDPLVVLAAARLGGTRLIDNLEI